MEQFIYFIQAGEKGPIKIGTTRLLIKRYITLQTGNHEKLTLLRVVKGDRKQETHLHKTFRKHQLRGEWYWPCQDVVDYINSLPPTISDNFNTAMNGKCKCGSQIVDATQIGDEFVGFCRRCKMIEDGRLDKLSEMMDKG